MFTHAIALLFYLNLQFNRYFILSPYLFVSKDQPWLFASAAFDASLHLFLNQQRFRLLIQIIFMSRSEHLFRLLPIKLFKLLKFRLILLHWCWIWNPMQTSEYTQRELYSRKYSNVHYENLLVKISIFKRGG